MGRAERSITAAGFRVGGRMPIESAVRRIEQQVTASGLWVELDSDGGQAMDELLTKVSADAADGRYAVISGGPSSPLFSQELGHLYVIDLRARRVVATVTGVGHEPYALALVQR